MFGKFGSAFALILTVILIAGCGGGKKVGSMVQKPLLVDPFKALPIAAYEGRGQASHSDPSIAREQAYLRAMGNLSSSIWAEVSTNMSEVQSSEPGSDTGITTLRRLFTQLPLPGQKFREDFYDPDHKTFHSRVYMSKAEVDQYLMKVLVENSRELTAAILQQRLQRVQQGGSVIQDELEILSRFHQDEQRRMTKGER